MPGIIDLVICLLVSAVAPAVAEELFFRGAMQQLFLEWTRKPHMAVFATAFLFSFLHVDPFNFISRFILGVALGYMFWWSGSLRLSIAAHFAFNAFGIVNIYLVQHYPESWWAQAETTYVLGAISLVVSLGALFTCRNLLKRTPGAA
jgi:membrane protease YdiL (CAAX protease family)